MLYLHFIEPRRIVIPISTEASITREEFNVVVKTGSDSHIIGPDATVSRNHARIYYYKGRYYMQDLGSLNGTRINGKPIIGWEPRKQSSEVELVEGAVIEIGMRTMFRVEFEKEAEEVSVRKDNCSMLLLLRNYLLEALNKIHEIQQGESKSLNDLQSNLEYIINKRMFIEMIGNIDKNANDTIRQHIDIMKKDPHTYQIFSELLDGLKITIKNIINYTEKEYELCTQSQ